jgi:tetratricopeptide (TPR) repeat protein
MNKRYEKDRKNIEWLSNGIYILLTMGENTKADLYLSELLKLAPTKPKVQQLAGMIAERDGKTIQALDQYEKSFEGDPTDLATIQMLGVLLRKQKSWDKSINLYRKALENHPNEPELLEKLGSLLIGCPDTKLRNNGEGIEYCERALDHKANSTETMLSAGRSLAQAYASIGDKQTAIAYLMAVIELAQNNNAPKDYLADLGRLLNGLKQ